MSEPEFRDGTPTERPVRLDANGTMESVQLSPSTVIPPSLFPPPPPSFTPTDVATLAGTGAQAWNLVPGSVEGQDIYTSEEISVLDWVSPGRTLLINALDGAENLRLPTAAAITARVLAQNPGEVTLPFTVDFECTVTLAADTLLAAGPFSMPLVSADAQVVLLEPITLLPGSVSRLRFRTSNAGSTWSVIAVSNSSCGQVGSFRFRPTGFNLPGLPLPAQVGQMRPEHVAYSFNTGTWTFPNDSDYRAEYDGYYVSARTPAAPAIGEAFDFYIGALGGATVTLADSADASITKWSIGTLTAITPLSVGRIRVWRTSATTQEWWLMSVLPL